MHELIIEIPSREYLPGEAIMGNVTWSLQKSPQAITLNIGWVTEGRGTSDSNVEYEQTWETEELSGSAPFCVQLPPSPYSFTGKLIELNWYISAEAQKGKAFCRIDLIVGPHRQGVVIG